MTVWPSDRYFYWMGHHSIAETKSKLSELVDRALAGDSVIITRHGRPVVELRPVEQPPRASAKEALDWLASRRKGQRRCSIDAATLVSQMRDEWDR